MDGLRSAPLPNRARSWQEPHENSEVIPLLLTTAALISMLFQLTNLIFRLFFPHYCVKYTAFDADSGKQLQSELAVAAEQGMVATRSQDHTPGRLPNGGQAIESDGAISSAKSRKRRNAQEAGIVSQRDKVKRRRTSAAKERSGTPASRNAVHEENSGYRRQSTPPVLPYADGLERPNDGFEVRIVTDKRPPTYSVMARDGTSPLDAHRSLEVDVPHDVSGITEQRQASRDVAMTVESVRNPADKSPSHMNRIPKATHKKFSEDEALVMSAAPLKDSIKDEVAQTALLAVNDETGSEDEAPEMVTALRGHDQARLAANEAARVVERQKAEEKRKRKELDIRLKKQVKAAKKPRPSLVDDTPHSESPISPDTLIGNMQHPLAYQSTSSPPKREPLPRLLPEELLNAEPIARPVTPPPDLPVAKLDIAKKRKLLNIDSKPPKDIQKGAFKIRVLPTVSSNLPPKSSKESKALRESWLLGQRGPKGGVERRKTGGGFVRTK